MAMNIRESGFLEYKDLKIEPNGVRVTQSAGFSSGRVVPFQAIDCVLMTADGVLSIQYGREVFKIRTRPSNSKHSMVIQALLQGLQRTSPTPPAPPLVG